MSRCSCEGSVVFGSHGSHGSPVGDLLGLRPVQGVVLAGMPALIMAYLGEEIEPTSLGYAMGIYLAGNVPGGTSGRMVTAVLSDPLPWRGAVAAMLPVR